MKFTPLILIPVLAACAAQAEPAKFVSNLPAASVHVLSITEQELEAQMKMNWQWRQEMRDHLMRSGGCFADDLPFEIATFCGRDAFGSPEMGSQGGD